MRYQLNAFNHSVFAYSWTLVCRFGGYLVMLTFWGKKCKNTFFREKSFFNQIFNQFIPCMWTALGTTLKNIKKVEISEETEFLRIFQKSHFPKSDYRFWKSYFVSSWDQSTSLFGHGPQGYTCKEQVQSILHQEISIHFAHFRFECKKLEISITRYSWEKKCSRKCYQKPLLMLQKHWNFEIIGLVVLSTQLHEEI